MKQQTNQSRAGFTLIELIIVISIMTILSLGTIVGYQRIAQGLMLDRAHRTIENVISDRRLEILNGNKTCEELHFQKEAHYFVTLASDSGNCETLPYFKSLEINAQNEAVITLKNDTDLLLRFTDDSGRIQQFTLDQAEKILTIPATDSVHYSFIVYQPGNTQTNKLEGHIYYLADDNRDPEKVNHVIISQIQGQNPDLQMSDGSAVKMQLSYPNADSKVFVDGRIMKSVTLILEKNNTALDPISVALSSVVDSDRGVFNQKKQLILQSTN